MRETVLIAIVWYGVVIQTFAQMTSPSSWPDMPLIDIVTVDSVMPVCDVANPPSGCSGITITNNEYVPGRMVMTYSSDTIYDSGEYVKGTSGMRIRIRGNSTGANLAQHPYKLKLSKKFDLMQRGPEKHKSKEWVLLSMYTWHPYLPGAETNTLTPFGLELSRYVGMTWEPEAQFVNVVLNGDYQGLYYLVESVQKGEAKVPVCDSGFLIENDAFWWNEDGVYFKTDHQYAGMGYTYKYPDKDDVNDSISAAICGWMNQMEEALWNQDGVERFVDYDSFARWIVAHDMLGTGDVRGSNMFLYRLDDNDDTRLMMGSLWDFDSSFRCEEDAWSPKHTSEVFYYPQLFKIPEFASLYSSIYEQVRPSVMQHMTDYCQRFETTYSEAFEESMNLHRTLYPGEGRNSLHNQLTVLLQKLESRLQHLDVMVGELVDVSLVSSAKSDNANTVCVRSVSGLSIRYSSFSPSGVYIHRLADGKHVKVISHGRM